MEIVSFNRNLLDNFVYDGVEKDISDINIIDIASYYASLGNSYLAVVDGRVIGIGGMYKLWEGWGCCWLFLNKEAHNHKVCLFKGIVDRMNKLIKAYNIKVITAQCMDNSIEAHRLLNHLGFVKNREIKMALYGRMT